MLFPNTDPIHSVHECRAAVPVDATAPASPNFLDSWFWETSDLSAPWETPTRPGRLMGAREFPRLSRESAFRLAEAKGITTLPEQTDYSLAEMYCRAPLAAKLQKARRFGFA